MTDNNSHTASFSSFPPSDWVETTLGKVCEKMYSGGTPSTQREDFYGGEIPWIRTQEVNFNYLNDTDIKITEIGFKNSSAKWIPKNTVVIAMYGNSAGRVAFSNIEATTNQACCNCVANKSISDPKFIFFNLLSRYSEIAVMANGAAQQNLSVGVLKELKISLPPLPEQQAIAAVLSAFDYKIELLREQNKTLEEIGKTLFKEWFGKYSVDRPEELPNGWRVGKLGEENFAEIIGSGIDEFDCEKIYLATANVSDSNITNNNEKITYQERPSRANMQPVEKSIWFAKMQDSRKLLMFDDYSKFEIENFILSTGFAGIKTTEFSHYFMWCFILSKEFDELKNKMANGAVQIAVNNTNLEKIDILVPDNETLLKFNELAKPIFKKIYDNSEQIQSLARIRDELLPKLMSGEIRVKGG